jgi:hypothetical protein
MIMANGPYTHRAIPHSGVPGSRPVGDDEIGNLIGGLVQAIEDEDGTP